MPAVNCINNSHSGCLKNTSDKLLVACAVAGCRNCFEALVYRYEGKLLHYLLGKVANRADAEDLLQETFVKAYKNLASYSSQWQFSTWIYTIASRLAISHYRKKQIALGVDESIPTSKPGPAGQLEEADFQDAFWVKIAQLLNDNQYSAIWLRYNQGMRVSEVAQALDKSESHIKVLLFRARAQLSEKLTQLPEFAEFASPGTGEN